MPKLRSISRHELRNVPEPTAGYAQLPATASTVDIQPVAVADPYDPRHRLRALARFDLLDRERRAGRIDEASFLVGREIEAVLETMGRIGTSSSWGGDSIDATTNSELRIVLGVERAMAVNALLGWMVRRLGPRDVRLLWLVLGCGHTFLQAAGMFQRYDLRTARYAADRFRDALAVLAEAKAAHGPERGRLRAAAFAD